LSSSQLFLLLCRCIRALSAVTWSIQASMSDLSFTSGRDVRRASHHLFRSFEPIRFALLSCDGIAMGIVAAFASWKTSCIIFVLVSAVMEAGGVFLVGTALLLGLVVCFFRKLRRAAGALHVAQYRNLHPSARQAR